MRHVIKCLILLSSLLVQCFHTGAVVQNISADYRTPSSLPVHVAVEGCFGQSSCNGLDDKIIVESADAWLKQNGYRTTSDPNLADTFIIFRKHASHETVTRSQSTGTLLSPFWPANSLAMRSNTISRTDELSIDSLSFSAFRKRYHRVPEEFSRGFVLVTAPGFYGSSELGSAVAELLSQSCYSDLSENIFTHKKEFPPEARPANATSKDMTCWPCLPFSFALHHGDFFVFDSAAGSAEMPRPGDQLISINGKSPAFFLLSEWEDKEEVKVSWVSRDGTAKTASVQASFNCFP